MKTFDYAWKSSNGARHVERMCAASREDVFTVLRSRGIKAITVTEIIPGWRKGMRKVQWLLFPIVLIGVLSYIVYNRATHIASLTGNEIAVVEHFNRHAKGIFAEQEEAVARLKSEATENRFHKISMVIDLTRSRLRIAYREAAKELAPQSAASGRLQADYGRLTAYIDEFELMQEEGK